MTAVFEGAHENPARSSRRADLDAQIPALLGFFSNSLYSHGQNSKEAGDESVSVGLFLFRCSAHFQHMLKMSVE